jgi:hypothetical protein
LAARKKAEYERQLAAKPKSKPQPKPQLAARKKAEYERELAALKENEEAAAQAGP